MAKKPQAIFICGPIAAGKSSSKVYFEERGYEQGVILDFDSMLKAEKDRLKSESKKLSDSTVKELAETSALNAREAIFRKCIELKQTFSYENCMSKNNWKNILGTFNKMKLAKENGFDVRVFVYFQKSLEKHMDSERARRTESDGIGAFFKSEEEAKAGVIGTYKACLDGLKEALKYSNSMKVFINYMKHPQEQNRPVLKAHYREKNLVKLAKEIDNPDLKKAITDLNKSLENDTFKDFNKSKGQDQGMSM